jgi:hypothetical protein
MKLLLVAALALNIASGAPPLRGTDLDRALRNYKAMLAGQKQLVDLPPRERRDVIELDRWLRSRDGIVPSETKEQCEERLASPSPSQLEEALLDLKCSGRPSER